MTAKRRKITIVGDKAVGKTSLLLSFINGKFVENPPNECRMEQIGTLEVDRQRIELSLWDTQSDQNYNLLRNLAYAYTDVFLVCYCIANPESLENVTKWNLEVRKSCPKASVILIGTKKDLRPSKPAESSDEQVFVTWDSGYAVKEKIKASAFLECSAQTREVAYSKSIMASNQI